MIPMEEINSIAQFIEWIAEYGVTILIAAIFLYVCIRLINIFFKFLEKKVGEKKHDKLLDERSRISYEIQLLIEQFLESHGGDRVQVIEFSNSVTSVAFLPFKYMTCTYECYALGKSPTGHMIDHISTSLFTTFFQSMQDVSYRIFDTHDKSVPMGAAKYELVQSQGASQSLCVMLHTPKGKSIGYITMKRDEGEFTEKDIEGIQILAEQVSALLSVADM